MNNLDVYVEWKADNGETVVFSVRNFSIEQNGGGLSDQQGIAGKHLNTGWYSQISRIWAEKTGNEIIDKEMERLAETLIYDDYDALMEMIDMKEGEVIMILNLVYHMYIVSMSWGGSDIFRNILNAVKNREYRYFKSVDYFMKIWHNTNDTPEHIKPFIEESRAMYMYGLFQIHLDDGSFIIKPDGPMNQRLN